MEKYIVTVENNGTIIWRNEKGKYHRLEGPAIEWANGDKSWYKEGLRHRMDGPAREFTDGNKEWYINGVKLSEEEFNKRVNGCGGKVVEIDGVKYKLTQV